MADRAIVFSNREDPSKLNCASQLEEVIECNCCVPAATPARQCMCVCECREYITIFTYALNNSIKQPLVFTRPMSLHANGQFKNTLFHVHCPPERVVSLCYNYAHYHFIIVKIIIRPVVVDFGREVCKIVRWQTLREDFQQLIKHFIPFELNI